MHDLGEDKAREIAEGATETTRAALLSADFDSFAACLALPHTIETPHKRTVLKTREGLQSVFDRVCEYYQSHNVTDLVRLIETAAFRGPNRIEVLHVVHLMAGSHRIQEPYLCFFVLERIGEDWLLTTTQYAVDQHTSVGWALNMATPELPDHDTDTPQGQPTRKEINK